MTGGSRIRNVLRALFHPPAAVVALAPMAIAAMMTWVFAFGNQSHPLAYVAYACSAYLLAVACVWVACDVPSKRVASLVRKSDFGTLLLDDADFRRQVFVFCGIIVDVLWAVGNLVLGVWWTSVWFITFGVYYLTFGLMRCALFINLRSGTSCTEREQARTARVCGCLLTASVFVLSGMVTLSMTGDGSICYDEITVIAVAVFTFYSLISSLAGFVRLRAHENMLVVTNCRVNLAIALVSLFTLEIGMFSAFATADDALLVFVMPIVTGACIALALCALGIVTVVKANRVLTRSR